jgi:hypothetical protein
MAQLATGAPSGFRERIVARFLIAVLAAGSLTLWIGIPVLGLWALSKVTNSVSGHLLACVLVIPPVMLAFAPFLFWVNGLYLRVTGVITEEDDDDEKSRRVRGPLEPMLVASLVIAATGLAFYILFVAPNTPQLKVV